MAASELTVVVIGDGDVDVRGIRRALTAASIDHDVVVVRLAGRGYGDAFREGAARATGRYLLTVDGDVAADPDVIERMWAARGSNGVVIASRYVDGGSATVGWSRHIASRLLNAIYRRGLSMHVRDLSSAYRLYRRDAIAPLTLHGRHFDVLEEVLVGINADGWPIAEVPFRYVATGSERSLARPLSLAWAFVRTFGSMWVLRNSPFSADYDERAFNSLIPLQRYWQRTRVRIISDMVKDGGRVLDIGCGSSRIIINVPTAVGLDIQLKKLRRIQRRIMRLVQGTLTTLPFTDGAFDRVICSQVIEHVPVDLVDFREFARVLRPGGELILGTPDYGTWTWPFLEWLYDIVHPRGYVKEHINHYTAASLRAELERHQFRVEELRYVGGGEMIFRAIKK
ncbi:MAG TPA: methyltransferase domain-containing protein [Vicinamibacterales bacterium]|nr:methyltransferase domain-containing protein [Vicinamibacterales bacterium]